MSYDPSQMYVGSSAVPIAPEPPEPPAPPKAPELNALDLSVRVGEAPSVLAGPLGLKLTPLEREEEPPTEAQERAEQRRLDAVLVNTRRLMAASREEGDEPAHNPLAGRRPGRTMHLIEACS